MVNHPVIIATGLDILVEFGFEARSNHMVAQLLLLFVIPASIIPVLS
jgi:hypothetical protein